MVLVLVSPSCVFNAVWSDGRQPEEEKLLEQLGTEESTCCCVLSAGADVRGGADLRGVPVPRLHLHRAAQLAGTAAGRDQHGLLFGGVHAGSAPALDLVPLAGLGFGLCLLYRCTGSLYPCIAAHALNNSLAFASLEGWGWPAPAADRRPRSRRSPRVIAALQARRPDRARTLTRRRGTSLSPSRPRRIVAMRTTCSPRALCCAALALLVAPAEPPPRRSGRRPADADRARPRRPRRLRRPARSRARSSSCCSKSAARRSSRSLGRRIVVRGIVDPLRGRAEGEGQLLPRRAQGRRADGLACCRSATAPVSSTSAITSHYAGPRAGARRALRHAPAGAFSGRSRSVRSSTRTSGPAPRPVGAPAAVRAQRPALRGPAERRLRRSDRARADRLSQDDEPAGSPTRGRDVFSRLLRTAPASSTCATAATAATSRPTSPNRCSPRSNPAGACTRSTR